jgi:hypothetical protein
LILLQALAGAVGVGGADSKSQRRSDSFNECFCGDEAGVIDGSHRKADH